MIKKVILVILSLLLVFGLVACSNSFTTNSYNTSAIAKVKLQSDPNYDYDKDKIGFGKVFWDERGFEKGETIYWSVLARDKKNKKALLLTRIGRAGGNNEGPDDNWCNNPIRIWLNNTFYECAFDELERQNIIETNVKNANGVGDEDTIDYVFFLSIEEAKGYGIGERELCRYRNSWNGAFLDIAMWVKY